MKKMRFIYHSSILFSVFFFSFTLSLEELSVIKISVEGLDDEQLKSGIRPTEFNELSIESTVDNIMITSFQITLARGNRAVDFSEIEGKRFDMRKYSSLARYGDRIVIEVKSTQRHGDDLTSSKSVMVLKVL